MIYEFGAIMLRTQHQKRVHNNNVDDIRLNTQIFQYKLNNQTHIIVKGAMVLKRGQKSDKIRRIIVAERAGETAQRHSFDDSRFKTQLFPLKLTNQTVFMLQCSTKEKLDKKRHKVSVMLLRKEQQKHSARQRSHPMLQSNQTVPNEDKKGSSAQLLAFFV